MEVIFEMDIQEKSYTMYNTPDTGMKKLPFLVYNIGHYYAGKNYFTKRSKLAVYLFVYTVKGSGYLEYRGNYRKLEKGSCFLIDCMEEQHYGTAGDYWEFRWMHVWGEGCKAYQEFINENGLYTGIFSQEAESRMLNSLLDIENQLKKKSREADFLICDSLSRIMTGIYLNKQHQVQENFTDSTQQKILKVIKYIQEHYQEKLSLELLAERMHFSKFHFLREFKKYTNTTPYQYISRYRIEQSKILLKQTSHTVEWISENTGYQNVNTFIRDFKKYTVLTPTEFRMSE